MNERYKLLEIDLDGIFQRLLLLQKKKYAALKVDEFGKSSTEVKGLDMKRREFSAVCKNVSEYVIEVLWHYFVPSNIWFPDMFWSGFFLETKPKSSLNLYTTI